MNCAELKRRALAYVYAEMAAPERRAAEQHLAACDGCRAEVRGMADMADLVGKVELVAPSAEFHKRFDALVAAKGARGAGEGGTEGGRRAGRTGWEKLRLVVALVGAAGLFVWLRGEWSPLPQGPVPTLPPAERMPLPPELAWRDTSDDLVTALRASIAAAGRSSGDVGAGAGGATTAGKAAGAEEDPTAAVTPTGDGAAGGSGGPGAAGATGAAVADASPTWVREAAALSARVDLQHWKLEAAGASTLDRDLEDLRSSIESMGEELGESGG